ncbi:hypothetical protein D6C80_06819 [Aureobasidium pullulans]|nr:hypothetical protein D6C80_06819 [Aureobasidium pullulans]
MRYLGIALASVAGGVSAFPASSGTFFNGSNPQAAAAVINGTTYLNSTTTRVSTAALVSATSIVPTTVYTTVYQGADHIVSTVYKTVTLSASSTPLTGAQGNFDWSETADAPVPTVTLSPAVHWDVVVGPQNLIPENQPAPLYYNDGGPRADPSVAHSFGTLDINYKIPAVNLDHTDCATSISYDGGVLSVKFADAACFAQAQGSWSSNQQLIFITYSNICQNFANGEFCYYVSSSLVFSIAGLTVTVSGEIVEVADWMNGAQFQWGIYKPEPQVSINGDTPTSTLSGGSTTSATPSSTNAACNAVDAKYGLPIGPLDVDFDRYLDDCLGYYDDLDSTPFDSYVDKISGTEDLDSKYVATEILEDETDFAYDYTYEEGNNDNLRRRDLARVHHLSRRGFTRSFNKQWSFQLPKEQKNMVESPWGDARLLKEFKPSQPKKIKKPGKAEFDASMKIFCVGCGASGSVTIQGSGTISPLFSLTEGYVTVDANMMLSLQLGVVAEVQYSYKYDEQLFSFGIPGLEYGIVKIGPMISVGVEVEFNAKAEGQLIAGATFGIQNAHSRLDLVNPGSSGSSGWSPTLTPRFEAEGEIDLTAGAGFPLAITCGIDIANGRIKADAGFKTAHKLVANANFKASAKLEGKKVEKEIGDEDCRGISTSLNYENYLAAVVGVKVFKKEAKKEFQIGTPYKALLKKGCIKLVNETTSAASPDPTETESPTESSSSPEATNTGDVSEPEASSNAEPSTTNDASNPENTSNNDPSATDSSATESPTVTGTSESDNATTSDPANNGDSSSGSNASSTDGSTTDPSSADTGTSTTGSSESNNAANVEASRKFRRWLFPRTNVTRSAVNNNTDVTSNSTIIDVTNQTLAEEGKTVSDWSFPVINFEGYNTTSDTEVLTLVDSEEKFILTSCADENIYLEDIALNGTLQQRSCTINWQEVDGSVIADGLDRILHYYNNTMSKLGVSRLRISNEKDIPLESVYVNLYGFNDQTDVRDDDMNDNPANAEIYYLAYDEDDNTLYPIACSFENASVGSKLFLAKDPKAGAELLASEDLISIVTGGKVSECHALDFKQPYGEDGYEAWNPDATEED